ncbi:MAG: NADH-quinone oxidoreductase subunit C [Candidatus Omnitrophica bacterium]|nr:NADH-quinone oxidoreductase subunit C [Candidatus Omnitrophota bacterium]MBU4487505.1 NADH-quinone oxidoreductase subunit C [Candidatus Omnitrophota bacterium]MCG2704907.1 NADH-quinone oxidoreductase subunit C [Candidatus Omnitrophota bacterium]
MTREGVVKSLKSEFGEKIKKFYDKSSRRIYVDVAREDVIGMVRFIFKDLGARFNIATAVDNPDSIEMMYHFDFDRIGLIVTIRAYVPKDDCVIDSILPIMKGAEWIEREIHELFGLEFKGHPNMKPLLLPDDWPADKHPMRKKFKLSTESDTNNQCS